MPATNACLMDWWLVWPSPDQVQLEEIASVDPAIDSICYTSVARIAYRIDTAHPDRMWDNVVRLILASGFAVLVWLFEHVAIPHGRTYLISAGVQLNIRIDEVWFISQSATIRGEYHIFHLSALLSASSLVCTRLCTTRQTHFITNEKSPIQAIQRFAAEPSHSNNYHPTENVR